jgi:hypothetical protein
MLFSLTLLVSLSPFRTTLAGIAAYNLTELLTAEAMTADLGLLVEIQTDISRFMNYAKIIHTRHFLDSHIGTEDLTLDHDFMTKIHTVHDYLTDLTNPGVDLEMTKCAFAPHVIELCEEPTPRRGSYWTVLQAEALRTRSCAKTISATHTEMNKLSENLFKEASDFLSLDVDFQPPVVYNHYITQKENLAQSLELRMRFLDFWNDLRALDLFSAGWLTLERREYLECLTSIHVEAGRNSSIVISLGDPILDGNWRAMASYWNTLCYSARGPLPEAEECVSSRLIAAFNDAADELFRQGMQIREWLAGGGWWRNFV